MAQYGAGLSGTVPGHEPPASPALEGAESRPKVGDQGEREHAEELCLWLLITPLAKGAYFASLFEVAEAELLAHFPAFKPLWRSLGGLDFMEVSAPRSVYPQLLRLSFVQGLFEYSIDGLRCVDEGPSFVLPEGLVWGDKYRGKTNEIVTQLALNLALLYSSPDHRGRRALLDPMAGRGTTLLWAARYGIEGCGIERDPDAIEHLHRHLKRQTKLSRIKHKSLRSRAKGQRRKGAGSALEFRWRASVTRLLTGDSTSAPDLVAGRRFSMIVADLPYGIQFTGQDGSRSPLEGLRRCAPGWVRSLARGGAMVLIFNSLQPRREQLIELFQSEGLSPLPFNAPHRMSDSILRDVVIFHHSQA